MRCRKDSEFSSTTILASISRVAGLPRFPSMARLATIALWCAWTVAAWEAGKKTGQDGWLDDHNYYRCLHGADPVTWDSTLESQAQAVADAMPPMAHSDSYNAPMPAGENLAMGMGTFTCGDYTGPYNQNCATHNWYEEYECWGFGDDGWKNPTCTIGHFTAMVWKKTTKIGCASNGNYFVCQYGAEPPNFDSGSCGTNECVEAKNYDEAGCKAGTRSSYKTDWGTGNGWCSSDLDEYIGDASTASACWRMCENTYGSDLTAIDWTPDGECYCQDDCQCMEDADDGDIHLITRSDVASLPNVCISACPAEEAAFEDCLSKQRSLDDDYFASDDDDGDDDDFSPNTCADVQEWLSQGECARGPSVCRTEYNAWVECHYEDMAREELFQACDFTCSAGTCPGQTACDWDGSPCAADEFCNFDGGNVGSCEKCSDEDHCDRGLPSEGEADCKACCSLGNEKSNRDNAMLLIIIIVCSVVGGCCLLAISTAIIYTFGGCFCFAKHKKKRVAEPSAPVPLAVAQYAEPPPMSPGTFAKTQEHIRRTAALMAEAPPSPGPPPLAPIKATETLAPEMP